MAEIFLKDVSKRFGKTLAVDRVTFEAEDKELVVLVGPSGCGKTTTLRMIAGLEDVTGGEIYIGSRLVNQLAPKDRNIAMVFQNYALYPYFNVYKNMAFGLKLRKYDKDEIKKRVENAAKILELTDLLDRKPAQLSGGQRQRVAMGRAIVRDPEVFLFDEPLSNLDAKLRVQMRAEIIKLHARLEKTIIYVTHDQVEAMTLADRIVVMNHGRILQDGRPMNVYNNPKNVFVAGFIGSPSMNFIPGRVIEHFSELGVDLGPVKLQIPESLKGRYIKWKDKEVILGIRPEHIYGGNFKKDSERKCSFRGPIEVIEPMGSETLIFTRIGTHEAIAKVGPDIVASPNKEMLFTVNMNKMHLFDPVSENVI